MLAVGLAHYLVVGAILFVLGVFGIRMIVTGRDRKRGALMLGVALVLVMNVLIWTVPMPGHHS